jgi:hypothetical protein
MKKFDSNFSLKLKKEKRIIFLVGFKASKIKRAGIKKK